MEKTPEALIKKEPHPDDVGIDVVAESEFAPVGDESLGDIMRRTGTLALAARRIREALSATTPQGWPDYKARTAAAFGARDTCDGKPIERQQIVKVTRTEAPPLEDLAATPAGIEALARMLARVPGGPEAFAAAVAG